MLYFTPSDGPVDKYVLEYGTSPGNYQYGIQNMGVNSKNQMSYLVSSLAPSTTYYFRVRGGNGCAAGGWSNELSTKTKGFFPSNNLQIISSTLETIPKDVTKNTTANSQKNSSSKSTGQTSSSVPITHDVNVKVTDVNHKPVVGAMVTIHSTPQISKTDQNGIAHFSNVEEGNHQVIIAYGNYQGEENINLAGNNVQEFNLNVEVKQHDPLLNKEVIIIICLLVLIILVLSYLILKEYLGKK